MFHSHIQLSELTMLNKNCVLYCVNYISIFKRSSMKRISRIDTSKRDLERKKNVECYSEIFKENVKEKLISSSVQSRKVKCRYNQSSRRALSLKGRRESTCKSQLMRILQDCWKTWNLILQISTIPRFIAVNFQNTKGKLKTSKAIRDKRVTLHSHNN